MRLALAAFLLVALASSARAQDAGTGPTDAGMPPTDAGAVPTDAGVPPTDAGAVPTDAGVPADVDAAAPDVDAAAPAPDAGTTTAAARHRVVVVDALPYGIDPIVGVEVTRTMVQGAAAMGYDVLSADESVSIEQRVGMAYPPTPADLWRVATAARAERALFARVFAAQGQYVVEMVVASTDGGGPFFQSGSAPAETLLGVVSDLERRTLPPPGVRTAPQQIANVQLVPPGRSVAQQGTAGAPPRVRPQRRQSTHWAAVAIVDAAFGLAQDFFFNFLAGARLDYRVTPDIRVGLGLLGGILRGKGGAVGNMLAFAQVEDRLRIATDSDVLVPLRLAIGYLPYNGPWVRLAAGVCIPFERRWEVVLDLLSVDFWVLPDHTVVSFDVAAEIGYRF